MISFYQALSRRHYEEITQVYWKYSFTMWCLTNDYYTERKADLQKERNLGVLRQCFLGPPPISVLWLQEYNLLPELSIPLGFRVKEGTMNVTQKHTGIQTNIQKSCVQYCIPPDRSPSYPHHLHYTGRNPALGQKSSPSNSASSLGLGRGRIVKGSGSKCGRVMAAGNNKLELDWNKEIFS